MPLSALSALMGIAGGAQGTARGLGQWGDQRQKQDALEQQKAALAQQLAASQADFTLRAAGQGYSPRATLATPTASDGKYGDMHAHAAATPPGPAVPEIANQSLPSPTLDQPTAPVAPPEQSISAFGQEFVRPANYQKAPAKIQSTHVDPVSGKVYLIYEDGTYSHATSREAGPPTGTPPTAMPGEQMPAPQAPQTLTLGVKQDKPPAQPEDKTLVPVQQPDGSVVYTPRAQAAGAKVPSPNSSGSASMQKALASNEVQMSVIDDATKELGGHESAVGAWRGLPIVGDFLDQRIDKGGVAARAQIANIGSMIFHDRSGAAITVSEAPRLKPFIPSIHDTPETIRTKLRKLREALEVENGFLRGSKAPAGPLGGAAPAKPGIPSFEEWQAAKKKGTP